VFRLKLTQALQLRHLHARVLALPLVVRGVADAVLAAQLGDRDSGFAFFEHRNDLAFGKSAFLQGSLRLKGGSEILLADVYSEGELTKPKSPKSNTLFLCASVQSGCCCASHLHGRPRRGGLFLLKTWSRNG